MPSVTEPRKSWAAPSPGFNTNLALAVWGSISTSTCPAFTASPAFTGTAVTDAMTREETATDRPASTDPYSSTVVGAVTISAFATRACTAPASIAVAASWPPHAIVTPPRATITATTMSLCVMTLLLLARVIEFSWEAPSRPGDRPAPPGA